MIAPFQIELKIKSFCKLFFFFSNFQAMTMMGLYDSAYWFSWLAWEAILIFLSSLLTVLFGMVFQFDFFWNNSSTVVFLVFFLFQLNMVRLYPFPLITISYCSKFNF